MTADNFTAVSSGISSQLVLTQETLNGSGTYGLCVSTTSPTPPWRPFEFKSESLALKKTTVQGQGLHAGGLFDRASRRVLTNYDAGGTISLDLPNRNLHMLLQHMTGSPQSTVTGITGSNISIPVQLGTTGAYASYHSPGNTGGMSLNIQKGVPTVDATGTTIEPFTYTGAKISDWEISCEVGAIVQLALTIDARNECGGGSTNGDLVQTTVPSLVAFSEAGLQGTATSGAFTDPLSVFHFRQGTLFQPTGFAVSAGKLTYTQGSALANIKSASFKETKSFDSARYFIGSAGFKAEQIENNFRSLTGSMVAEFLSAETYYNAFATDSTTSLQLQFIGGQAGTAGSNSDTLIITFPNIKLDGESPQIGGPGVVTENVAFTGLDDNATVPYQIQYFSSDSAL
jgi:hypothetical protein